jgi:hypothetical protein
VNRRNYPGDREAPYGRPPQIARRPSRDAKPPSRQPDNSATGCESAYLNALVERACELVVVLRQGDNIVGRLAWYDQTCLKLTPSDGSPSLVIPKGNIKYLYEAAILQAVS